jgi:hypothetical protein
MRHEGVIYEKKQGIEIDDNPDKMTYLSLYTRPFGQSGPKISSVEYNFEPKDTRHRRISEQLEGIARAKIGMQRNIVRRSSSQSRSPSSTFASFPKMKQGLRSQSRK